MVPWDNQRVTTLQTRPDAQDAGTPSPTDRSVSFISWGAVAGRHAELAEVLGGEARCFFPKGQAGRPPVIARYALSAARTAWHLLRRRPRVVVVTNPPVPAAWFTAVCARAVGAALIVDSHPGGFGAQGDRVARHLQWMHRRLVRRAAGVIVSDDVWSDRVRSWGGTPLVVHEAPIVDLATPPSPGARLAVLVVGNFHRDEPYGAVLEAASRVPACDFLVTGELSRCAAELRAAAPANVQFVGFLDPVRYRAALHDCDAVLTLTTEPTSVMRAAYEAVYAGRPVIVSDWPLARSLFPFAVHSPNDPSGLAAAIERLCSDYPRLAVLSGAARAVQLARWDEQLRNLADLVDRSGGLDAPPAAPEGVPLDAVDMASTVQRIVTDARLGSGGRMANVNVDTLRLALEDPELRRTLESCELVMADGMPIVWAARLQGTPVPERVAASEMIWPACEEAADQGVGVFLLGGSPGTAERAATRLAGRFPGLQIGHWCPPMGFERDEAEVAAVIRALDEAQPGVVFCGLGTPKQERLMAFLANWFPSTWFVACGGTFAMVCGELPPAPPWMRRHALEWLHRLRLEPRRLFGRYLACDLPFVPRLLASSAAARSGWRTPGLLHVRQPVSADGPPARPLRPARPSVSFSGVTPPSGGGLFQDDQCEAAQPEREPGVAGLEPGDHPPQEPARRA